MSKLTFRDEFNTLSLWNGSSGTWQPSYDWAANGLNVGTSWFVNPMYGPTSAADDNVYSVSNGALSIAIKPTPSDAAAATGNTPFLSGQLETKPTFSQLYGYFEINAVLPSGGTGISSAFWLLPENGSWPPELDVFEQDTSQGLNAVETGVFTNQSGSTQQIYSWDYNLPNLAAAPHTYAVDWEVNTITWYIDGQQVFQTATPADMHQPMYMLIDDLTTAVGSWNGSPAAGLNTSMQVNWVHAYDSNPYVNGVNSVLGGTATNPGTGTTGGSTGTTTGGTTGGTTGTTTGGTTSGQPVLITPGVGTFKDAAGNAYTLSAAGDALENGVLMNGGSGTGAMELANGVVYAQDAASKTWYTWNQTTWTQASAAPPAVTTGGGSTVPPPPPPPTSTSHFTVSATGGFVDTNGHTWTMCGLNAGVQDALQGFGNVLTDYPGLTTIRLNTGGNDSAADIDKVVQEYTARGVVVMLEDHSGNPNNVAWYQQMATAYKGNARVFLEMPNEPNPTNLSQIQIGLVNAIRAAGFTNPVALQPAGGYDFSNIAAVTAAVGTNNIFITPHIYYGGTDPNGAAQYVANDISTSLRLGLFPAIDEFGDAMDGWHRDPYGAQVIQSVIAANQAGKTGAVFWAMDNGNHPDGTDSAFLYPDGSQLTPVGKAIQPWLSQYTTNPPPIIPPAPVTTGSGSDALVLSISEDAYQGDAQFTVSVDGKQLGGTFTTTALHVAGVSQSFTFKGDWAAGAHAVSVNFLNDLSGGTAATDRNLYVNGISYNGTATGQSRSLNSSGPQGFSVTDSTAIPGAPPAPAPVTTGGGSDTLVLSISEDAYQGDAQFIVSVDGKQLGGTFTTTASHVAGVSQSFTFKGDWAVGAHPVVVNFLNDAWGGSSATDRNLYINAISYNGTVTSQSAELGGTGPQTFSVTDSTAIPITPPVTPPGPASVTTGSGSDALALSISEDAYQGDAQFTVSVDGKQLGGTFTTTASHAAGVSQSFTFKGDWAVGAHPVVVNFLNDAWGGSSATDRNLYVNAISYNGTVTSQSAELGGTGPQSFSVTDSTAIPVIPPPVTPAPLPVSTGTGSDSLVLSISEDAYQGDAQFTVSVDAKQLAGIFTTTASHAAAASQSFTFKGDWATGAHTVSVNFLNDLYGGTGTTDRNLYVNGISYDGTATGQSRSLNGSGPQGFSVTDSTTIPIPAIGAGSDALVLKVSEDAYQGDAQFTVSVDGKQLGGTLTATSSHTAGQGQILTFRGDFGAGSHAVTVNFLNDLWVANVGDRNLYVDGITYGGTATGQTGQLLGTGPMAFAVSGGTTPSVAETGDHGSLTKNLSQTGSYVVGGDTFVLTSGNAASVTLGTGTSVIKFIGASAVTLTAGSGQATVTADAGSNKFVAGTGTLDVTGGGGRDAYVFHDNGGLLKIEDFASAKGDTLTVDKALQGSMVQASDGQGGTMLTFGAGASHGVDIRGLAAMPVSNFVWA